MTAAQSEARSDERAEQHAVTDGPADRARADAQATGGREPCDQPPVNIGSLTPAAGLRTLGPRVDQHQTEHETSVHPSASCPLGRQAAGSAANVTALALICRPRRRRRRTRNCAHRQHHSSRRLRGGGPRGEAPSSRQGGPRDTALPMRLDMVDGRGERSTRHVSVGESPGPCIPLLGVRADGEHTRIVGQHRSDHVTVGRLLASSHSMSSCSISGARCGMASESVTVERQVQFRTKLEVAGSRLQAVAPASDEVNGPPDAIAQRTHGGSARLAVDARGGDERERRLAASLVRRAILLPLGGRP